MSRLLRPITLFLALLVAGPALAHPAAATVQQPTNWTAIAMFAGFAVR